MAFPKAIITKPFLISTAEYQEVGQNITLVGYDEFSQKMQESKGYASPRILNWVEPYEVGGERKTLFYTEVNSNIKAGDKVFIINGTYDSDLLIKKDKYKKGRDGYTVLKADGCKIALDIDYTGALPYKDDSIDDFIKIYYIDSQESFIAANRQITSRGGKFDYKFGYGQNNIAFIDKTYGSIEEWGRNGGVYGVPGFFVREENSFLPSGKSVKEQWNNISDKLVYLGSFSVAHSPTYKSNGKILIMNGSFEYNGISFKEGTAYKWNEKNNSWEADVEYSVPVISKSNFRSGTFKGKFNNGAYGSLEKKISWSGAGTWNGGTILNSTWKSGAMNSGISISPSMKAEKDQYGIPFQKPNTSNNAGFGYNYVLGCEIEKSLIENGNFIDTKISGSEGTFSVVEEHILGATQSFDNVVNKAFFELCEFKNTHIKSGEVKNTRSFNSKFTNVKSINSYFEQSVLKDSTYIGDGVMKVLGYDEWNMSEYRSDFSGSYSYIGSPNSKIYKFYISKESFERMKAKDTFFIKGIRIKDSSRDMVLDFFDSRFRISSWNAYYDELNTFEPLISKADKNSFYKRGYEMSAFLSSPEENAYAISSYEHSYQVGGSTFSRYRTEVVGPNTKKGYSIDIVASRHDIFNKTSTLEESADKFGQIPRSHNYGVDVDSGTASMPNYIGDIIDFSGAYIIDADFHSGIIETSDWNSGYHINYNNDVALCGPTSTGRYDISLDSATDTLLISTPFNEAFPEKQTKNSMLQPGDVVFLNSVDYDCRGMVTLVTLVATGSSYSTTNPTSPAKLLNTKISGTTMSATGSGYFTSNSVATTTRTGSGKGLELDIVANPIGSVLSITYSAPMSSGGSYSIRFTSSIDGVPGPIGTSSFVQIVLTDTNGTITGATGATYTVVGNSSGQPVPFQTAATGSALANAIYATGPSSTETGLIVRYYTLPNGAISNLKIESPGQRYLSGQVFEIEGGRATFSIVSVSAGEIVSYSVSNPGEDYIAGDIIDIPRPYDPNSWYVGKTASLTITSITHSYFDEKGLSLNITTGTGALEGKITDISISNPGLYYSPGEIFTLNGGNLDALVKIESVEGSVTRLGDTYKIVENNKGKIRLSELGTQSVIAGLTSGGVFYTADAMNRWNYISKLKIDRSKIKSGIFRRTYITRSLIRDSKYSSLDKDFLDISRIKNLMVADALFSSNGNILSSATYMHSIFCGGNDLWNDGIIFKSVLSGMTFSKGTVKSSTWLNGTFNGGTFYDSRSFDARPSINEKNYLSDSLWLYYMKGEVRAVPSSDPAYNGRYAWYAGTFNAGEFFKSDWDSGIFNGGLFYNSKFYSGTINNGIIGTKNVAAEDTKIYDATINNATINNAYVYADDSSYSGLSSSTINWYNGVFNAGVFGSNNNRVLGWTISNVSYNANIGALPIKDFKLTEASVSVSDTNAITGEFDIEATITLKHTYIGDLIINLMAPNGNIINLKKKYSGGSNDNMINSVFTSDDDAPSIEIWTAPYTGKFKFAGAIGQGVYYTLSGNSIRGAYKSPQNDLAPIKKYTSVMPTSVYDGDRYLVVATASDPLWNGQIVEAAGSGHEANKLFPSGFLNTIVEYNSPGTGTWIFPQDESGRVLDDPQEGDRVSTESGETLVYYKGRWTRSYHSNTSKISDLLSSDKTVSGTWKLLVMDDAGIDTGFVDEFSISFSYKNSYLIKAYRNTAIWHDGIFNGGQFIDLGIWKDGTFNGGKFISTYGWTESGNYLNRSALSDSYTWQGGEFNGGEFGNESKQANSTWYGGEFNGGTFKGRLWNDGVFTYGEFKGGSNLPAIGSSIDSEDAGSFISEYRAGQYYGAWRKGIVSEKKDEFVTDKKIFTPLSRAVKPQEKGKKASFANMLWLGGIFNHQSGEMTNSLWLDGLFKKGKMEKSAFNPYVVRFADIKEFSKDDSSIWEDGTFINGEFHYSKWMQGKFISGTAVGMIWKNGIAGYMNAYNVFWENGVWRNGNWNGSMFEYNGKVEDGFAREILNRGIEWSGTSSCHIWNLFESDTDKTVLLARSGYNINTNSFTSPDSFATDNVDDAGITPPYFTNPSTGALTAANYTVLGGTSIKFSVKVNKGGATLSSVGIAYTSNPSANSASDPSVVVNQPTPGTFVVVGSGASMNQYEDRVLGDGLSPNLNSVDEDTIEITVTNLNSSLYYNFMAVAFNGALTVSQILKDIRTTVPLNITGPANITQAARFPFGPALTNKVSIAITYNDPNVTTSSPTPTADACGIYIKPANLDGSEPDLQTPGGIVANNATIDSATLFTIKIQYGSLSGNTKYYYRVWAENEGPSSRKIYPEPPANSLHFTTGSTQPGVVFTAPGTAAASTSLSMTVTNNGSSGLRCGFKIWKSSAAPNNNAINGALGVNVNIHGPITISSPTFVSMTNFTQTQGGPQTVTINLADYLNDGTLEPGTIYKVVAFAVETSTATADPVAGAWITTVPAPSGGYSFANLSGEPSYNSSTFGEFKTDTIPAGVNTTLATSPSATGATLNGNLLSNGGNTITQRGFIYRKEGESYPVLTAGTPGSESSNTANNGILVVSGVGTGAFSKAASGLTISEKYYYKAYAMTSTNIYQGPEQPFVTLAQVDPTSITRSNSATSATGRLLSSSATGAAGGSAQQGVPVMQISVSSSPFNAIGALATIQANTKYYIRWKITNAGGDNYYPSTPEEAITLAEVSTNSPENISFSSVKANVVANYPSLSINDKGIVIYPTANPGAKDEHTGSSVAWNSTTGAGSKTITGLTPGTQYTYEGFVDATAAMSPNSANPSGWAKNLEGGTLDRQRTYSGDVVATEKQTFWTKAQISASAVLASGNTITVNGITIVNTGGSTVTEYGIIWKHDSSASGALSASPTNWTLAEAEAAISSTTFTEIERVITGFTQTASTIAPAGNSISKNVPAPPQPTPAPPSPVTAFATGKTVAVAYVRNQSGISISSNVSATNG